MKAKKKEIKELHAGLARRGPRAEGGREAVSEPPPARKAGVKVADVEELWKKLHDEAKVL